MRLLDLFSGIGGFSLAASWVWGDELEIISFCESDKFCQKILDKHWPGTPIVEDVRDVERIRSWANGAIDLITGGPPCQNTSTAAAIHGRRDGTTLWPEMGKVIEAIRPVWIIVEQPTGNKEWENQVKMDLEGIGYKYSRLERTSQGCGAPHKRRRVFIVANTMRQRLFPLLRVGESRKVNSSQGPPTTRGAWRSARTGDCRVDVRVSNWVDRIKSLGNSVDPRVAAEIMQAMKEINEKSI